MKKIPAVLELERPVKWIPPKLPREPEGKTIPKRDALWYKRLMEKRKASTQLTGS